MLGCDICSCNSCNAYLPPLLSGNSVTLVQKFKNFKVQTMPLSPFLASSRQPPVAASCSCCQPCSHGRHAGNIDCKTSRCSSTVRRGHSCERGSNEIPLQLLSIQLCQIYESIFLMLFSCHLWDFTDMPKQEQVEASFTCHLQPKCTVELNADS